MSNPGISLESMPPCSLFAGGEVYLVDRAVSAYKRAAQHAGWDVNEVSGQDTIALAEALGGGFSMVFGLPCLTIVDLPTRKLKTNTVVTDLLLGHQGQPVIARLHAEPKVKGIWGSLCTGVAKKTRKYLSPPFYKRDEYAANFCVQEAKSYGINFPIKLATMLVTVCGTDLGMLAPEVQKACMLATLHGEADVSVKILRSTIAPVPQKDEDRAAELKVALSTGQIRDVSRALTKCSKGRTADPTIGTLKMLEGQVLTWFLVADLLRQEANPSQVAEQLGLNPWYVKQDILPTAQRLGWVKCRDLYLLIGKAQRLALSGRVDPWQSFSARCLAWCPR